MAIPILYYFPGVIEPRMNPQPTQQIDILPTILSYLGYDEPFFGFGRSLFEAHYKPFAVNYSGNYQLVQGNNLLLFDGAEATGFYDLESDPTLKQNLIKETDSETITPPLDFLKAFIQQYNNRLLDGRMTP